MVENSNFTERREHQRTRLQNLIVGILNSDEPAIIGSIIDISLGGLRYQYALRMSSNDYPVNSIDIIADAICLIDIPCEYAWDAERETRPDCISTDLKQCGIKFGRLTPYQIFLLEDFISRFPSLETKSLTSSLSETYPNITKWID